MRAIKRKYLTLVAGDFAVWGALGFLMLERFAAPGWAVGCFWTLYGLVLIGQCVVWAKVEWCHPVLLNDAGLAEFHRTGKLTDARIGVGAEAYQLREAADAERQRAANNN